jgi:hypothetical protein
MARLAARALMTLSQEHHPARDQAFQAGALPAPAPCIKGLNCGGLGSRIVGQKGACAGRGKRRGGHFPRSGTKQRLELVPWRDRGSTAAHCAVFDPRSPVDTLWGYISTCIAGTLGEQKISGKIRRKVVGIRRSASSYKCRTGDGLGSQPGAERGAPAARLGRSPASGGRVRAGVLRGRRPVPARYAADGQVYG